MTHVLVTGAAGFIGSHLSEALTARGDTVIGIDNFDPFYSRAEKERNLRKLRNRPSFTFHETDLLQADGIRPLLQPDSVIVHLAARPGVRPSLVDPAGYARVNVEGTASLLRVAQDQGVTRFIFGSSSSVYGDDTKAPFREDATALKPLSPYAATKRSGELMLESLAPIFGLRATALRFFTVYGPRQRPDLAIHAFARKILAGQTITLFGDGTQSRDYTYCDDIVAGIIASLDWTASASPGLEIFNLGGNEPVPLREMVAELGRALGREPRTEWAPMQPGDVQHTYADLSKSGSMLGYRPRTTFSDGLRRFATWLEDPDESQR
ncbi:MAG: NAD-dependent epimerase/dehydratase family protein [Gemmatimonadota bacterium]